MSAVAERPTSTEAPMRGRIVVEQPKVETPAQTTPPPSTRKPIEFLHDQIQIGATIASLLVHNFGGDGDHPTPAKAPGVDGMVSALKAAAVAAHAMAKEQGEQNVLPLLFQASSIAEHMSMLGQAELFHGDRGFRLGDGLLCMSFWTLENLLERAGKELNV